MKELSAGTQYLLSNLSESKDKEEKAQLVINATKAIKALD
jgi:hypothetical protein